MIILNLKFIDHGKIFCMETSTIRRTNLDRPSIFDNRGWLDKVSNSPLDDYLNFCRSIDDSGADEIETEGQYSMSIAPGPENESRTRFEYKNSGLKIDYPRITEKVGTNVKSANLR